MSSIEYINSVVLTTSAAAVTFSGIPDYYEDLMLEVSYTPSGTALPQIQFNQDTGSNYSDTDLTGNGSSASSGRDSNQTKSYVGNSYNGITSININIMSYSNNSIYKTMLSSYSAPGGVVDSRVNLWRSTSIINEIKFYLSANSFNSGSTFTLWGVR